MRVVVMSDTHLPRGTRALPNALLRDLASADLAIHLGDFTGREVVQQLEAVAPLVGVHGNNDTEEVRRLFPAEREVELGQVRVLLLHGHRGGQTALSAARRAVRPPLSAVLFGHSHQQYLGHQKGVLLLNPGSPTERRWGPHVGYAVLDVDESIHPRLVTL